MRQTPRDKYKREKKEKEEGRKKKEEKAMNEAQEKKRKTRIKRGENCLSMVKKESKEKQRNAKID